MFKWVALLLSLAISSFGYTQTAYKHPSLLGVAFIQSDFRNRMPLNRLDNLDAGLSIQYTGGFSRHFDWQVSYTASFPDSFSNRRDLIADKKFLSELDLALRSRLFPNEATVQPYLLTGIGTSYVQNKLAMHVLAGPGVQLRFKDIHIQSSILFKPSLSQNVNRRFAYSIGIAGIINSKKSKRKHAPAAMPANSYETMAKDSDGDGILDSTDGCPMVAGLLQFRGCPDSDGDGLQDKEDDCPTVHGSVKYRGCLAPDTDGDGIRDDKDSCVTVPGVTRNLGCPEVSEQAVMSLGKAANNIYFETGRYTLLPTSYPALDTVIRILNAYPFQHLSVEGHTDDVGRDEANRLLSENRAKTVVLYLTSKGVAAERLRYIGYGTFRPIADNKTPNGRAQNRRVELKLVPQ